MDRSRLLLLLFSQAVLLLLLWQLLAPEDKASVPAEVAVRQEQQSLPAEFQQQSWAGRELPSLSFRGPEGDIKTDDFRGQPLVLEFISTTCPYCQEMASRFARAIPGSGAEMITVSVAGESLRTMRRWHQSFLSEPMPGLWGVDSGARAVKTFDLRGTPTTLFIRPSGEIAELVEGEFSESNLRELLRGIGA